MAKKTEEKTEEKSAKVTVEELDKRLKHVEYLLRKLFTRGKTPEIGIFLLALLIPALSFGTGLTDDLAKWNGTNGASVVFSKAGGITATGVGGITAPDLTASDDVTVGDDVVVAGQVITTPASYLGVVGGTVTVTTASMVLYNGDAAVVPTLTNTVAAPATAGLQAVIINVGTGSVVFTEGTTLDSGGNKTLGPEDVLMLFAPDTSAWKAIYHDN